MKRISKINRRLNSVGKMIFDEFFDAFQNEDLSPKEIVEKLSEKYGYSVGASLTRITNARYIIRNGFRLVLRRSK